MGMHALVLQVLQELPKPIEVHQPRRLCQVMLRPRSDLIHDQLQRLNRLFDKFSHCPNTHTRLILRGSEQFKMLRFDPLQTGGFFADLREISVRMEKRNRPCPTND
jgi:hypothetical protein